MSAPVKHPLPRGTRIMSIMGEQDYDSEGEERITDPDTIGVITGIANERDNGDPGFCYDIEFPNGMWITRDDDEISNPERYSVVS